jgi:hypothetical protein
MLRSLQKQKYTSNKDVFRLMSLSTHAICVHMHDWKNPFKVNNRRISINNVHVVSIKGSVTQPSMSWICEVTNKRRKLKSPTEHALHAQTQEYQHQDFGPNSWFWSKKLNNLCNIFLSKHKYVGSDRMSGCIGCRTCWKHNHEKK